MNDSSKKTVQTRSRTRKPAPAGAGSTAPAPPADGQGGDPAPTLARAAPKGAVQEYSTAVAHAGPVGKPVRKAGDRPAAKASKPKLVRGTFTLPKDEYATLAALKKACQKNGVPVKKNQLLRVAIALLRDLDQARLAPLIAALPATKRAGTKKGK